MPTETITVAGIWPPKEGRRTGSLKTTTGDWFDVWPDKIPQFSKGGTYVVEYATKESNGRVYKTVKAIVGAPGGTGPSPAGANPRSAPYTRQDDPAVAERIFVCGIVNAAVPTLAAAGDLRTGTIAEIVRDAREAWRLTFGAGDLKGMASPTNEPPPHEEDPFAGR